MSAALVDADARRAITEELGTTLVVEAAAGTGKTRSLVLRIVALVTTGTASLATIVAVTFTEKAAAELKLRLRQAIEGARAAAGPVVAERLTRALAELEVARISTLHAFAGDLLREHPVEAGVDPLFEIAVEDASLAIFAEAFEAFYQAALADPPPGVRRVLRRHVQAREGRNGPRERLFKAGRALIELRDFPAGYRRDPLDREAALDAAIEGLRLAASYGARATSPGDYAAQGLNALQATLDELDRREALRGARDHDGLEHELSQIARRGNLGWRGRGTMFGPGLDRTAVLRERDAAVAALKATLARCDADLAACLRDELRPLVADYEARLARAGRIDFLDLLRRARDLVVGSVEVRRELAARFTHLLIDEFQDTDPLQAALVTALARDPDSGALVPGKLFIVGDPKQSIYRFRRADVGVYHGVKAEIVAGGGRVLQLSSSFRSAPSIQRLVNATFAPLMTGKPGQATYVPLSHTRPDEPGRTHVVALPSPLPYGEKDKLFGFNAYAHLPEAVAEFIATLLQRPGEVERLGLPAGLCASDVCLLFKRFNSGGADITAPYVEALARRGVRHLQVGGRSFHDREEIAALRAVLSAIEWPDDELSVFAALRGSFFALPDDALLVAREELGGRLDPLRARHLAEPSASVRPVVDALRVLASLHHGRNRRPLADTLGRFFEAVRLHAGVAIWPGGEQALANLLRTVDLARRFEAAGATSFRAFVERLRDDAAERSIAPAPIVEDGADGVRVMTAFTAKGLEFEVVVLCDPAAPSAHATPSRFVDAEAGLAAIPLCDAAPAELIDHAADVLRDDRAETARLAYVAATRARSLLVVPVVGDPWDDSSGWISPLQRAVLPSPARRGHPSEIPDGFGYDTVGHRPSTARVDVGPLVSGFHAGAAGERVLVWEPSRAGVGAAGSARPGLANERILAADAAGKVADEGTREHAAWVARRAALLSRGATPSHPVVTVTARAHASPGEGRVERVVVASRALDRPRGPRFGSLVHAALAEAPRGASPQLVERLVAKAARQIGAQPDELAAARHAVVDALSAPLMVTALSSDDVRREVEITLREADGTLLDGTIDLAFRDGEGWVVVDFKTDLAPPDDGAYDAQVQLYARAVAEATGLPARAVLLFV